MKKILLITHQESMRGSPKIALEIGKALGKNYSLKVVSMMTGKLSNEYDIAFDRVIRPLGNNEISDGKNRTFVRFVKRILGRYNYFSRLLSLLEFLFWKRIARRIIASESPDLVYVNGLASLPFAASAQSRKIPVIFHIHELASEFEKLSRYQIDTIKKLDELFIACGNKVKDHLVTEMGIPDKNVRIVHSFVNVDEILAKKNGLAPPMEREMYSICGIATAKNSFTFFQKGIDIFVDAARLVNSSSHTFNLNFLWIGAVSPDCINKLGVLPSNVHFLGYKSNPLEVLNACDIFVLSSREDSFPLVALEAMALKKSVVAFKDGGGIAEALKEAAGVILDKMDSRDLATAILDLLANEAERIRLGEVAFNTVITKYNSSLALEIIAEIVATALVERDTRQGTH